VVDRGALAEGRSVASAFSEGIFDLFTGLFEIPTPLVVDAVGLQTLVVRGYAYLSLCLASGDLKYVLCFIFDGHDGLPSHWETSVSLQHDLFLDFRRVRAGRRGREWNSSNHQKNDDDNHDNYDRPNAYVHDVASFVSRTSLLAVTDS
jgi:hypothetical protein